MTPLLHVSGENVGFDPDMVREKFFSTLPRYEYLGTLGRGGMAFVYKAFDRDLKEEIAIKVLWDTSDVPSDMLLARFKSEINLNRKIKHPNVCRLYDFGMTGTFPYITMEYVPGLDLGHLMDGTGSLPPVRVVRLLRQVAAAVAAGHEVGIVHRDLKPANVIVRPSDEVSVLDYGLAHEKKGSNPRLTRRGDAVGTPHYMSPEQVQGKTVDERSDIYSLGVIAFEALTGTMLYDGSSFLSIARKHLDAPVPRELLEKAGVPRELSAIVVRCLRKEPEARFQTAGELADQLGKLSKLLEPRRSPSAEGPRQSRIRTAARRKSGILDAVKTLTRKKPLILVVDDEDSIRKLVSTALRRGGFDTIEKPSGEAALEFLGTQAVDLVLIDVQMPRMDGFDTVRVLKTQPDRAGIPVVFMSGFPEKNRIAFAGQTGAVDFLPKPLNLATLLDSIRRILKVSP